MGMCCHCGVGQTYAANEVDNLKGDYSKIKNKLGWEPKTSFEDMIKLMVNNDLKLLQ